MLPFALDPSVILGNLDAQAARPAVPKFTGPDSFDNHLQQAAQAGSNAPGANNAGVSSSGANSADNSSQGNSSTPAAASSAKPSGAAAHHQHGADHTKKPASTTTADGKIDHSHAHPADNAPTQAQAKHDADASASKTASDAAKAASTDAKPASSDAATTTNSSKSDATKPTEDDTTKADDTTSTNEFQPAGLKVSADPISPPPSGSPGSATTANPGPTDTAKSATPTVAPAIAGVDTAKSLKAISSRSAGKTGTGSTKTGATAGAQHSRSAAKAKATQADGDASQSAADQPDGISGSAPLKPGDPTQNPAGSQQAPAEQIANQISNASVVVPVAATQLSGTPAESTASATATVQAAASTIDASQIAAATSEPTAAAPTPMATAASNLVAPSTTSATTQQDSPGAPSATGAPGANGAGAVANARFVQRVAKAFQTAGDQGGSLRLRLSPPDLGSLKLNVTVTGGVLSARVQAETSQARDMLLDNLPALRERLAEHNIKIDQFEVELFDSSTGGSSDQPHGNSDPQQAYAPAPARNSVKSVAAAAGGQSAPAASPTLQAAPGRLNVVI